MSAWSTLLNVGTTALNSSAGQNLLNAGVDSAKSKLFGMDGFEDVMNLTPNAPLAAPKPAPEPEKKPSVTDEKWFWPAVVGVVVLVIGLLSFGRKKK